MAILAYDDVMLREPRLLVPGMRPLGMSKIDRENSIGSRIKNFFVPVGLSHIDIAERGQRYAWDSGGGSIAIAHENALGRCIQSGTSYNQDGVYASKEDYDPLTDGSDWVIFYHVRGWVGDNNERCVLGRGADLAGNGWSIKLRFRTARLFAEAVLTSGGVAAVGGSITQTNTGPTVVAVRLKQGSGLSIWVKSNERNGFQQEWTSTKTTMRSSTVGLTLGRANRTTTATEQFGGFLGCVGIVPVALPDAAMLAIISDPYQFLIPA